MEIEVKSEEGEEAMNKLLECPVCLTVLMPPIHQCYNGHLICQMCIVQVTACPVCREQMPTKLIRNRAVEELTKNVEFDCKNKDRGCTTKLKPADFEEHTTFECQYASLPFCEVLGIPSCKWRTTKRDVSYHMATEHGVTNSHTEKSEVHYEKLSVTSDNSHKFTWKPSIFHCLEQIFFLKCEYNPIIQSICWTPYVQSNGKMAKEIYVTLKVSNALEGCTAEWSGPAFKIFEKTEKDIVALVLPIRRFDSLIKSAVNNYLILSICFELKQKLKVRPDTGVVKMESGPICESLGSTIIPEAFLARPGSVGPIHQGVTCDICSRTDIEGVRFKCLECEDYDICERCERVSQEHNHHIFARLPTVHPQIRVEDIAGRCFGIRRRPGLQRPGVTFFAS